MRYSPSSKVLFVSICSLTKAGGGEPEYDVGEAITCELTPRLARKLLWRREQVRKLVRGIPQVAWQGVALSELEYNRHLVQGADSFTDFGIGQASWLGPNQRQHPFGIRHEASFAHISLLAQGVKIGTIRICRKCSVGPRELRSALPLQGCPYSITSSKPAC